MAKPNEEKLRFYESLKNAAIEQQIKYGIPASVTLAQAWIEHGEYSKFTNNYFGIHDDNGYWRKHGGQTTLLNDHGKMAHFRVYNSPEQGIEDHSRFFFQNQRYKACYSLSSTDHAGWANGICDAGYAEKPANDPGRYARIIEREINDYGLDKIDQEAVALAQRRGQTIGYLRSQAGTSILPSSPGPASSYPIVPAYCFPIAADNLVMSDGFGIKATAYRDHPHNGIDLRARYQDVFATENQGKVVSIGYQPDRGGKFVAVEYERADGSKWRVSYCHLDKISVSNGDIVNAGTKLGVSGNTGNSTGPHLHLTVKHLQPGQSAEDVKAVDPLTYLAEIAVRGNLQGTVLKKGTNVDLLANLKGSVDTTPTPGDRWLAEHQQNNLSPEQLHNAEEGALLADATGSNDPKNMLAYLLGMNGDQASQGGDLFSSLISSLFTAAIGMAMQLDRAGNDVSQTIDDGRRVVPADTEDHTVVKRQRDGIDPVRARELATMNFEAESPQENYTILRQRT
jgi:murein DD-endopeptidase MepM/ murein hydrolase activator NlpD